MEDRPGGGGSEDGAADDHEQEREAAHHAPRSGQAAVELQEARRTSTSAERDAAREG